MAKKFVFEVRYVQTWEHGIETSGYSRVAVKEFNAQLAIDKAMKTAAKEESDFYVEKTKSFSKCTKVVLTDVKFVTDYEE